MAYALLCLVVPALWGLGMYVVMSKLDQYRQTKTQKDDDGLPPIDYEI